MKPTKKAVGEMEVVVGPKRLSLAWSDAECGLGIVKVDLGFLFAHSGHGCFSRANSL